MRDMQEAGLLAGMGVTREAEFQRGEVVWRLHGERGEARQLVLMETVAAGPVVAAATVAAAAAAVVAAQAGDGG